VGVKIDQGVKGAQDALDFLIARRDLLLSKIREREGLGEREDMFRPVIPLQRFGSRRLTASACAVTTNFISPHKWSGNRGNVPEVSRLT